MENDFVTAKCQQSCSTESIVWNKAGQLAAVPQILTDHRDNAPRGQSVTTETIHKDVEILCSLWQLLQLTDKLRKRVHCDDPLSRYRSPWHRLAATCDIGN